MLTCAAVSKLYGVSQVGSGVDAGRSIARPVVPDQLGVNVHAGNIVDDATNFQFGVLKQIPQQRGFPCTLQMSCAVRQRRKPLSTSDLAIPAPRKPLSIVTGMTSRVGIGSVVRSVIVLYMLSECCNRARQLGHILLCLIGLSSLT